MLLSYDELVEVVNNNYLIGVQPAAINATSIDLHLGTTFKVEPEPLRRSDMLSKEFEVDLKERESILWRTYNDPPHEDFRMYMRPSRFILAHTIEIFNLPDDLSAEFSLKSSLARNGLEHLLAGWIDPGFNSSVLTLELKNSTQYHTLLLTPGMPIGQVKFFRHAKVPADKSYRARGRYNGDLTVSGIKK